MEQVWFHYYTNVDTLLLYSQACISPTAIHNRTATPFKVFSKEELLEYKLGLLLTFPLDFPAFP